MPPKHSLKPPIQFLSILFDSLTLVNEKVIIVLDKNKNFVRRFKTKYLLGNWLRQEMR